MRSALEPLRAPSSHPTSQHRILAPEPLRDPRPIAFGGTFMRCRPMLTSLGVAGLLALLIMSGCILNPNTNKCTTNCPVQTYRPLTTPVAALFNLRETYKFHDAMAGDEYATLLDPNRYQFRYYDPQSMTPTKPLYFDYGQDVDATRKLFLDVNVSSIALTFPLEADTNGTASSHLDDPPGTV